MRSQRAHYDTLAAAIVPEMKEVDKFWKNAAKFVFRSALKKLAHEQNLHKLFHILVRSPLSELSAFCKNTDAATYTDIAGERMTISIRSTLTNHLQSFQFLKPTEKGSSLREPSLREFSLRKFSIRKWVTSEHLAGDQWLFLSMKPDQRETLVPLLSGWLAIAINALMTLPRSEVRRLWFIIDELPSLQKLPSLATLMTEIRKYGGCVLAGVQDFPQLYDIYGHDQARSILNQFNTKIFFRNTEPEVTSWISRVLGEAETTEQVENLSYGAHSIRDGVSIAPHTHTKPLILPTEIARLREREAFIMLPGPYPICKTRLKRTKLPDIAVDFKPVPETELRKRQHTLDKFGLNFHLLSQQGESK